MAIRGSGAPWPSQAKIADKTMLVYAATKGAIASFTVALSNLLAPDGIRVNCVAPGPIWTPLQPIVKSPAQPAALAPAYALLASDLGSDMSGALIPVTGGVPMR